MATGECLRTFEGHSDYVSSVCFSADDKFALSGSADKTLKLWDLATGKCLRTFEGQSSDVFSASNVFSVCFSADDKFALSGSADKTLKLSKIEEYTYSAQLNICQFLESTTAIKHESAAQDFLAKAGESFARLNFIETADCIKQARSIPGYGRNPEAIELWTKLYLHLPHQRLNSTWNHKTLKTHSDSVSSVCFSFDGKFALSGSWDKTLKLWDVVTGECLRTFEGHSQSLDSVCFSADDKFALSGSADKTLKLWDLATGECLRTFEGHSEGVKSVCFSSDGKFALSGSSDQSIKLWFLDWELEEREVVDWDDGARPYLNNFLTIQTPYAGTIPTDRKPTDEEITQGLTRKGKPQWNEQDFERLLYQLGCAGFGYIKPEEVRRELEKLSSELQTGIGAMTSPMSTSEILGSEYLIEPEDLTLLNCQVELITEDNNFSLLFDLSPDEICSIGRSPENSIVLSDPYVSRYQAFIIFEDGKYAIYDGKIESNGQIYSSSGGIYFNGRQQNHCLLFDGCEITFGHTKLIYRQLETYKLII